MLSISTFVVKAKVLKPPKTYKRVLRQLFYFFYQKNILIKILKCIALHFQKEFSHMVYQKLTFIRTQT